MREPCWNWAIDSASRCLGKFSHLQRSPSGSGATPRKTVSEALAKTQNCSSICGREVKTLRAASARFAVHLKAVAANMLGEPTSIASIAARQEEPPRTEDQNTDMRVSLLSIYELALRPAASCPELRPRGCRCHLDRQASGARRRSNKRPSPKSPQAPPRERRKNERTTACTTSRTASGR